MIRDAVRRVMLAAQARGLHRWAKRVLPSPIVRGLRSLRDYGEGGRAGAMLARQDAAMAALEQRVMREVAACNQHFSQHRLDMLIRHDDTLGLIEQRLARRMDDRLDVSMIEVLDRHDQVLALFEQKLVRSIDVQLQPRLTEAMQRHDRVLELVEQRFWRDVESRLVRFRTELQVSDSERVAAIESQLRSSIQHEVKLRLHEAREAFVSGVSAEAFEGELAESPAHIRNRQGDADAVPLDDSEYASFQDLRHNVGSKRLRYEQFIESLGIENGPLLDIGCGDGSLLEVVRDGGIDCVGIDSNRCMVKACLEKSLDVRFGDAVDVMRMLPDASFGAVVSLHVVEHLSGPALRDLIAESTRVLRPGGVLAFETPKVASLPTLADHYFADPTHRMPRHHSLYGFLLEQHGLADVHFEDVRANVAGKLGALPALASEYSAEALEVGQSAAEASDGGPGAVAALRQEFVLQLDERLAIINEALFVPRDVRVVARKPGPAVEVVARRSMQ